MPEISRSITNCLHLTNLASTLGKSQKDLKLTYFYAKCKRAFANMSNQVIVTTGSSPAVLLVLTVLPERRRIIRKYLVDFKK